MGTEPAAKLEEPTQEEIKFIGGRMYGLLGDEGRCLKTSETGSLGQSNHLCV